ncbi:Gfo/Idh/MocA family oxidoreductase [Flavobacteriaceae bacterium F89]|uniref:Gfo/Idh/MocA family oxidoreductase n=1 Tax=Cerina litoralis TaxID=2874477 RepID=A0AAE3EVE3_9FLAO|nr:Gfo/Idh/MocA family oxidoreductase [Cerina litoralis]MCG2461648.1 Gfo/Idh/MocA family oxidoreductase [Cerina litoralis]
MGKSNCGRRSFIKQSTVAFSGLALTPIGSPLDIFAQRENDAKPIRLGFVGIGGRGSYHLDVALGMEGVMVPAICEIKPERLYNAKRWIEEAGQPSPRLYDRGLTDFERLCEEETLDAVICSTSWEWHAPVCLAAMNNDKHAVSEVPIVLTLDEAWALVETSEKTGKWATLALEQAMLESSDGLALLNMVQKGLFGEILHTEGGYIHDLRFVKNNPAEEPWRLAYDVTHNGNLYPDHPMNRIMAYEGINRGDRLDHLVSMGSKGEMLHNYAVLNYGRDSEQAKIKFKQSDVNATLIRTVNGKLITLNYDTNTPHPRGLFRLQGTKGVYLRGSALEGPKIYLEGLSPKEHEWESAGKYLEEYQHPTLKNYKPAPRKRAIRGHGGSGSTTPLTWHLLVQALRENKMPYFDVYDSVTSSVIFPLSNLSVANKSKTVDVPDFTKGKWKSRPPLSIG